jgi:hypothetical protein
VEDVEELMDPLRFLLYLLGILVAVWLIVYVVGQMS